MLGTTISFNHSQINKDKIKANDSLGMTSI